jgi:intracellular sulfur oxidation DsrE/DsrF family protein
MVILLMILWGPYQSPQAEPGAELVFTPYEEQKVVFEFYFDHPKKIGNALYWLLGMFHTLNEEPYGIAPDFLDVKVILHGTEIVTLAKANYSQYKEVVERMRYYTEFGVEFRVCATSAHEYGYQAKDFQEFVMLVPNAVTEIVHWQSKGYSLVVPQVLEKHHRIDEIR